MSLTAMCSIHNTEMDEKDGKYGPFFSHRTEDGWCNGKVNGQNKAKIVNIPAPRGEQPDWEAIGAGKTRCAILCAVIEKEGVSVAKASLAVVDQLTEYVMAGRKPGQPVVDESEEAEELPEDIGF